MIKFFEGQYDYIYFFYGLSFFFLFIVCLTLEKDRLGKLPWLFLGFFGLAQAIAVWMEIYAMNLAVGYFFFFIKLAALAASYLLLFKFARQGIWGPRKKSLWPYAVFFCLILWSAKYGFKGTEAGIGYFIGLPSGLLSAFSIYNFSKNENNPGKKTLFVLGALMVFYSFISGLIVPASGLLFSKWLNSDSFRLITGFPVQFLRGLVALSLAVVLWCYSPNLADSQYVPQRLKLPFKPTKWIIMFSLVFLIGLGWIFTNYLDYYAGIQIIKNTKENRNSPLNKLIDELTRIEQSAYLLSRYPSLKSALDSGSNEDIAKALVQMNKYKDRCAALDTLLLNSRGVVVTSTDWTLSEGKNRSQANSSYFKEALRGETGYYFLPGSTYNERLYYVAFPVKNDAEKVIGVIVFKKIISVKPIMKYRLLSIIVTMFICMITMVFFVVLRRKENLIEFIEEAHNRLKTVDKMKTDFISIVSHELRTPLTAIKNSVSILLKPELASISEENKKELLAIILKNTDRQTRMVNDLLDISKIEAGVLDVCPELMDILEVVKEALNPLEVKAKEKNIELSTQCGKNSLIFEFDPEHLRRILTNLVTNAINFTPQGGKVSVKVSEKPDRVIFCVSDTGIGICDEDKVKLFNKFYRAPDARARQKGGSGLGLVIAKGLVEIQGGRIWVDSVCGKGSSFYFTIPISQSGRPIQELAGAKN